VVSSRLVVAWLDVGMHETAKNGRDLHAGAKLAYLFRTRVANYVDSIDDRNPAFAGLL
jgi:hypothetical protein